MMKTILLLISLFALLAVTGGEAKKVAILGDPERTALLLSELADEKNIELYERAEIDRILAEHNLSASKLSAGNLARLFPHTDLFVTVTRERLIVFNAKNGCRLRDTWINGGSGAAEVRQAVGKLEITNPLYLSIVSVRDIGVPRRIKPAIEESVLRLEQTLICYPAIQILERARLNEVNKERELTGKRFDLIPSAQLLTLEFEPGGEPGVIQLKVLIHDRSGRETARFTHPDAFEDIPAAAAAMAEKIATLIPAAAGGDEAKRFFEEYNQMLLDRAPMEKAAEKLHAALALQPMNAEIRYAELEYQEQIRSNSMDAAWVDSVRRQLERSKQFRRDFPGYDSKIYHKRYVFGESRIFGRAPGGVMVTDRDYPPLPPEKLRELQAICVEFRELHREELKRLYYPYDLSDGINSLKELGNYAQIVIRTYDWRFYADYRTWLDERLEAYFRLLRYMTEYAEHHPEERPRIDRILDSHANPVFMFPLGGRIAPESTVLPEHLKRAEAYIRYAEQSPFRRPRQQAASLRFMQQALELPRTRESLISLLDRHYEAYGDAFPELGDKPPPSANDYFIHWYLGVKGGPTRDLPDSRWRAYQERKNKLTLEQRLREAINARNWKFLKEHLPELKEANRRSIVNRKTIPFNVSYAFSGYDLPDREAMEVFHELNSAFDIETRSYGELFGIAAKLNLRGALQQNGKLFLLFSEKGKETPLRIGTLESGGKVSLLPDSPVAPGNFSGGEEGMMPARPYSPWAVSDTCAAIAQKNGTLAIYTFAAGKWDTYPDAAPRDIRGMQIDGERIYFLCGGKSFDEKQSSLVSFSPASRGHRVHFATLRTEKHHDPEKKPGAVNYLIRLNKNEFSFLLTDYHGLAVYRYRIAEEEFEAVATFPLNSFHDYLFLQDGFLYCNTDGHGSRLYRIDPATGKSTCLLTQTNHRYKLRPDEHPLRMNTGWSLQPPFLFQNGKLWSSYYHPAIVDMEKPEDSPVLVLPPTPWLCMLGDAVYYLSHNRYFSVREK